MSLTPSALAPTPHIGPSHHLFYASLFRREEWLHRLTRAFEPWVDRTWAEARARLEGSFKRRFARLDGNRLEEMIDDRPVDSFLESLSKDLEAYEHNLFDLIAAHHVRTSPDEDGSSWLRDLEEASMLWGRQLAQECLLAPAADRIAHGGPYGTRTVFGLLESIQSVWLGGNYAWRPILVRRYTREELEFEPRACAHCRPDFVSPRSAELSCRMEALLIRGFARALTPHVDHNRIRGASYCMDRFIINS